MAVYKRTYTRYTGQLTDERWRFTVLPRFAFQTIFASKFTGLLFTVSFLPHLVALVLIYLRSHLDVLTALGIQGAQQALGIINVDGSFFLGLFVIETFVSFFLVSLVGPGLVTPDLNNNAMHLYLSRPFSRTEYVMGKLSVLVGMLSLTMWIPGLLLIGVQTSLVGFSWLSDHFRVIPGVFLGSLLWIFTISLMALAISAWVKWKPVAVASLFGIFFVAGGFGAVANVLLDMRWGIMLQISQVMIMVWRWLFLGESTYYLIGTNYTMPAWWGLLSIGGFCSLSLYLLNRKIRATQVVRG